MFLLAGDVSDNCTTHCERVTAEHVLELLSHRQRGIQYCVINWIIVASHFPPRSIGFLRCSLITLEGERLKRLTAIIDLLQEFRGLFPSLSQIMPLLLCYMFTTLNYSSIFSLAKMIT